MQEFDEKYMNMCFELAKQAQNDVRPNPMVGCVILDKNKNVVSKGYHKKYGENHAERDALLKLQNNEAMGGTLYVNLEPCSHYGKTPPCVDLIIERKLARVVIGMKDVNPKVDGISKLKQVGIKVDFILEDEAKFLNRVFIKNMTTKLPYVVLKTATTMDGKIATHNGSSKWITSNESRDLVYAMREEFDGIMTSSNTVIADNPFMVMGENKWKCILDKNTRTNSNFKIYEQGNIYIATKENTPIINNQLDIKSVLEELYRKGVYKLFVESGGTLAGSMLKDGLIDEIYQFIAPKIINDNTGKSCFNGNKIDNIQDCKNLKIYDLKQIGKDILIKSMVEN